MANIKTHNLTKKFGQLTAVDEVTFEIQSGRVQAIIGPNGAGKTTYISCITGQLEATAGDVKHNDESIHELQQFEIARRGITLAKQLVSIYPTQTVLGNVVTAAHMNRDERLWDAVFRTRKHRQEKSVIKEEAMDSLEAVGLEHLAEKDAETLAYGEKKRVMIAGALVSNPEFLILDEPVAGLNPEESHQIMEILADIVDEYDIGVVLIEHDMDIVMTYSDLVMVLSQGQKIAEGVPNEIQEDANVQEAYLG